MVFSKKGSHSSLYAIPEVSPAFCKFRSPTKQKGQTTSLIILTLTAFEMEAAALILFSWLIEKADVNVVNRKRVAEIGRRKDLIVDK